MSLLTIVQTACRKLSLPVSETVIGNTDATIKQMLYLLEEAGKDARDKWRWPQLTKEHTWTLTDGTANYAFPADTDYHIFKTHWDRTNYWELMGPLTAQEWQQIKSGLSAAPPRKRFRVKGMADAQIFIDPTPGSSDAGNTLVLEYQSLSWIRPVTWTATTAFDAGAYCFYNGNYYTTTLGGTTGSTAPTHTSSSASDGGVTWTYSSAAYEVFTADDDVCWLDETTLTRDLEWRFRREKGLEWESFRADCEDAWKRKSMARTGSKILSLAPMGTGYLITDRNIPDTFPV